MPQILLARTGVAACLVVLSGSSLSVHAQDVDIDNEQSLSEDELAAGFFDDDMQSFVLGVDTTFNFRDGGRLLRLGGHENPFSLNGATMNFFAGGALGSGRARVSDVTVNVFEGAQFFSEIELFENSTINVSGGELQRIDLYSGGTANFGGGLIDSINARGGSVANFSDGTIRDRITAGSGSVVNITGGTVEGRATVAEGGVLTVSGGDHSFAEFSVNSNAVLDISGGTIARAVSSLSGTINLHAGDQNVLKLIADRGSNVNLFGGPAPEEIVIAGGSDFRVVGGEFMLNGAIATGLDSDLQSTDVLTGTLSDGSVFIIGYDDRLEAGSVVFEHAPLDPVDLNPIVHTTGELTKGLRAGQHLTLTGDGSLSDSFAAVGATLDIQGGAVGSNFQAAFSDVTISGGSFGRSFKAMKAATVDIQGGDFETLFALQGSLIEISGGEIRDMDARDGSIVNINGGTIERFIRIESGATLNISDGSIGSTTTVTGGVVNMTGGTMRTIDARQGTAVTVTGSGLTSDIIAESGCDVFIKGGLIDGTVSDASRIVMDAGRVTGSLLSSETLHMHNGVVEGTISAFDMVRMTGGSVLGFSLSVSEQFLMEGGTITGEVTTRSDGSLRYSGGSLNQEINVRDMSELIFVGTEFFIAGVSMLELTDDLTYLVTERDVTLTGTLRDGTSISYFIGRGGIEVGEFASFSIVIPTPGTILPIVLGTLAASRRRRMDR